MNTRFGAVVSVLLLACATTHATTIEYALEDLGSDSYRYTYNVINDSSAVDIEQFTVYFELGLYENLVLGATPADWDPLAIQPDPGLPDDGFYDALALVGGIALGEMLGGFSVEFDWLGAGVPGSQDFEVFDIDFNLLDTGVTQLANSTTVPEPGAIALLGLGLLLLRVRRRQHRVVL